MKLEKARRILSAMDRIVKRGEHFNWSGLTHIAEESGLIRQTTYRYLLELIELGYVERTEHSYHRGEAFRYYMTKEGKKFLKTFQELDGLESVTK